MAAKDRYESLKGLSGAVIAVLWLDVLLQVLYVLSTVAVIAYMGDLQSGRVLVNEKTPDLSPSEIVQLIVALLSTVVTLSLYFMIGRWIFRAAWNLRHLGAKRLEYTPGWAVGWYFIPFANLVMPLRAMREIWLASHEPARWRDASVGTLSIWWTLWLLVNLVGNVSWRLTLHAETLEDMIRTEWVGVGLCVLSVPLSLVFMGIVRRVRDAQDRSIAAVPPPGEPDLPDALAATAV